MPKPSSKRGLEPWSRSHPHPLRSKAGLMEKDQLKGIRPPKFYVGKVELQNSGELREGMSGDAKILVGRRSAAGLTWRFARDLVGRRMW